MTEVERLLQVAFYLLTCINLFTLGFRLLLLSFEVKHSLTSSHKISWHPLEVHVTAEVC